MVADEVDILPSQNVVLRQGRFGDVTDTRDNQHRGDVIDKNAAQFVHERDSPL